MSNTQKHCCVLALLAVLVPCPAWSDSGPSQPGGYLDRHRYQSVINAVTAERELSGDMDSLMILAMALRESSELHELIQRHALSVQQAYLGRILKAGASRFAGLYLAEVLLQTKDAGKAGPYLDRFLAQKDVPAKFAQIARIHKARALYLQGRTEQARKQISTMRTTDAEVRAELVSARTLLGMQGLRSSALELKDIADAQLQVQGAVSIRVLNRLLELYGSLGEFSEAWARLREANTGAPVFMEQRRDGAELRFYSAGLPGNIARIHRLAAMEFFAILRKIDTYRVPASYMLQEIEAWFPDRDAAAKKKAGTAQASPVPEALRPMQDIVDAVELIRTGDGNSGELMLDQAAGRYARDPEILTRLLQACARVKARCETVRSTAAALSDSVRGDAFRLLQSGLGVHSLSLGNEREALEQLEAGRDKSRKNSIEVNQPLNLMRIAELYRKAGVWSEHLEIYFELAEEFPTARIIYDAAQGIYAMEQNSAGEVKVF